MTNVIRKEKKFTFFNAGTPFVFNALKEVYNPVTRTRQNLMNIHRELVKEAIKDGRKDVFILDHTGNILSV